MKWYRVVATTTQPISFSQDQARAFFTPTLPWLPGSALRGALAGAWLARGYPTDGFAAVFDGGVRFSPLVAGGSRLEPQSVYRCKYHSPSADHLEHVDAAFDAAFDPLVTSSCRGAWDALKGTYSRPHTIRASTGAALTEDGTAAEGALFSAEVLPAGTEFSGHIVSPSEALMDKLRTVEQITVGSRRTVRGRCQLRIESSKPPEVPAGVVVVRTTSPSVLVDEAGRPCFDLGAAVARHLGAGVSVRSWGSRSRTVAGWHMASQLPKPWEQALAPGAVAAISGADPSSVAKLVDEGVGLRRAEGFGWLEVATSAWAPARATTAAPQQQPEQQIDESVYRIGLSADQRQWAAKAMLATRRVPEAVDAVMAEPQAQSMSDPQHDEVRRWLLETPERLRPAVAGVIKAEVEG